MKKNNLSILSIIILTIFFFCLVIFLITIGKIVNSVMANNTIYIIFILICILSIIVTIIWTEFINYRDVKRINKKLEKEYIKENDFSYYRDKVANYSPAVLSYCYNKKINYQKILAATLIDLSQKDYIKFDNNSIILLKDDFTTLEENEKFVLESIKYNRLSKMHKKEYLYYIKKDCFDKQIYTNIKNFTKYSKIAEIVNTIFIIAIIATSFLNLLGMNNNYNTNGLTGILTYLFTFIVSIVSFFIIDKFFSKTHYRTEKGIDISVRLQGLRKFIIDFTDLKNKNIKDIKLYDEYILYTLLLDVNGNLDKEANQMIKKIIDKDDNT